MSKEYKYQENEDTSLFPIFSWFKNQIVHLLTLVGLYIRAAFKNYILTGSFLLISILIATYNFYTAKRVYQSSAILTSKLLSTEISERFIEDLQFLASEKNHVELANFLNITKNEASQIKNIKFSEFGKSEKDSTLGEVFLVNVLLYNTDILENFEKGILGYLNNNYFVSKSKKAKQHTLKELAHKIDKDVKALDSLKNDIRKGVVFLKESKPYNKRTNKDQLDITYLNPIDELYTKSISLYKDGLLVKEELKMLTGYDILQSFTKYRKPHSPKLVKDNLTLGMIFFILAAILSRSIEKKKSA